MFVERPPMTTIEPTRFITLGSHYRQQADACLRVANEALSPYDEEWRRLAAYWAKLARETETRWRATSDGRAAKLAPRTLALMHGPFFVGDGAAALRALADDYDRRLSDLAR
jgi:hypothetical protein